MDSLIQVEEEKKKLQFLRPIAKTIAILIGGAQPLLPFWCAELLAGLIFGQIFLLVSNHSTEYPDLDIILPSWIHFSAIHLLKFKLFYMLKFQYPIVLISLIAIYFASVVHGEKGWRLADLRKLYERLISISKWKASLTKFICTSVMSFACYFALVNWMASGLIFVRGDPYYVLRNVLSFVAILLQLVEVDSVLSLGDAISDGKDGLKLWKMSTYFKEGGRIPGILIMVIRFGWCFSVSTRMVYTGEGDNYMQVVYSGIVDLVLYSTLAWAKVLY